MILKQGDKVDIYELVRYRIANAYYEERPDLHNPQCYEHNKVKIAEGYFQAFGVDSDTHDTASIQYTTVIVMLSDGSLENIPTGLIRRSL